VEGPGRGRRPTARRALAACLIAASAGLAAPAASEAFVGCTNSAGTLTITTTERGDRARVVRNGDSIVVVVALDQFDIGGSPSVSVSCSGPVPTVTSTDLIKIDEAPAVVRGGLEIDLSGGVFAPGATAEADGTSEIEFRANMTGDLGRVTISGTGGPDLIDLGAAPSGGFGANLNGAFETAPDVDVELNGVEVPTVIGKGGPDQIRAAGAEGFAGPLRGPGFAVSGGAGRDLIVGGTTVNALSGGDGEDKIYGGPRTDYLIGGSGADLVASKAAPDFLVTRGARRERRRGQDIDRVRCGKGRDYPFSDRADRKAGCERLPEDDDAIPRKLASRIIRVLIVSEDILFS
jgi:Ca2+-binding RTX toxin-like protein